MLNHALGVSAFVSREANCARVPRGVGGDTATRLTRHRGRPGRAAAPQFEGLRAIAILLVVVFHAFPGVLPGGYVGVDVFFVISGFLITGLLLEELHRTRRSACALLRARADGCCRSPRSSWPRSAASSPSSSSRRVRAVSVLGRTTSRVAVCVANWHFAAESVEYMSGRAGTEPRPALWSLAVEEQFYVVWPLLIILIAAASRGASWWRLTVRLRTTLLSSSCSR